VADWPRPTNRQGWRVKESLGWLQSLTSHYLAPSFFIFIFGFELRALHLLSKCSTT
jgi:hypothetical protein